MFDNFLAKSRLYKFDPFLKNKVSGQKLFALTQQVLAQNNVDVTFSDGIYYLTPLQESGLSNVAFGFGRSQESVPNVSGQVLQLVKLNFQLCATGGTAKYINSHGIKCKKINKVNHG